jgi:probable DNA metabolism protein
MHCIAVHRDYDTWRDQARSLLAANVPPAQILWQEADDDQLLLLPPAPGQSTTNNQQNTHIRVPAEYRELSYDIFHHRDPQRFGVLYRLLWRLTHGERNLLAIEVDDDVRQAVIMQRQVKWDTHRMSGFTRFEKITDAEGELYLAWYRPDHYVVPLVADSFVRRFGDQRWSILTPDDSAHWDPRAGAGKLRFGPGVAQRPATNDQLVSLWQTYYMSTYNPQRDNPKLFRQHVPTRFLQDMPEGQAIAKAKRPER